MDQVRRVHAGLVEITARFARPYAAVRAGGRDHLVDRRGRLLPRVFAEGEADGVIVIAGCRFDRPQRAGEPWPGADIAAAIAVLDLVLDRPWRGQVAEIDVSRFADESSVRLRTDRGCTILWGRPPGQEYGGEVPAEQKILYLDYHHDQYGHIDRGFLEELDVTGDVVIGR